MCNFINIFNVFRGTKKSPKTKKPKAVKVPKTRAKDRKKKDTNSDVDIVETPPKPKR